MEPWGGDSRRTAGLKPPAVLMCHGGGDDRVSPRRWAVEAVDRLRRGRSRYESDFDVGVDDRERTDRGREGGADGQRGGGRSSVRMTFGAPGGGSVGWSRTPPGVCPVTFRGCSSDDAVFISRRGVLTLSCHSSSYQRVLTSPKV